VIEGTRSVYGVKAAPEQQQQQQLSVMFWHMMIRLYGPL